MRTSTLEPYLGREAENGVPPPDWCRVRRDIVRTARAELHRWRTPAGRVLIESEPSQLPVLRDYWSAVPAGRRPARALALAQSSASGANAWSAVFVCHVMRTAGVRPEHGFAFSQLHMTYIVEALRNRERSDATRPFWLADAIEIQHEASPRPGDLVCWNRPVNGSYTAHSYDRLRAAYWAGGRETVLPAGPSHTSVVVGTETARGGPVLITVGGNESNSVGLRRVSLNEDGGIANPSRSHVFGLIKIVACDD